MTTGACTSRTLVIIFSCFWVWTSAVPAEIRSSHYVTTKRVFSTSSWQKDFAFFREFLGVVDPSNVLVRDATGRSAADAAADARFPHLAALLEERVRAAEDAHRRRYEAAGYNIFR